MSFSTASTVSRPPQTVNCDPVDSMTCNGASAEVFRTAYEGEGKLWMESHKPSLPVRIQSVLLPHFFLSRNKTLSEGVPDPFSYLDSCPCVIPK